MLQKDLLQLFFLLGKLKWINRMEPSIIEARPLSTKRIV